MPIRFSDNPCSLFGDVACVPKAQAYACLGVQQERRPNGGQLTEQRKKVRRRSTP